MTALRLTERQRLDVLAAAVLDTLNELYTEGELDDDSSPPQTTLYNLADAMLERHVKDAAGNQGREAHADEQAISALGYAAGEGYLGAIAKDLRKAIEEELGA